MENNTKNIDIVGVILAAGKGTRLKPYSINKSKELINFLGKPLIAHHVDEFIKNNIFEIVIICNNNNITEVKNYFDEQYNDIPELKVECILQKEQRGPAYALTFAKEELENRVFLLKYGDSLAKEDQIASILKVYNSSDEKNTVITLRTVKNPQEYGIVRIDENAQIVEIIEKPKSNPPSNLAVVGLAIISGDILFPALFKYGFDKEMSPMEYVIKDGHAADYWIFEGKRIDMGRCWNILEANSCLIDKLGARIDSENIGLNTLIDSTAFIGKDAVIEDNVTIDGYSYIEGTVKAGTKISDSVIMKGTIIGTNCNIRRSIIGENCFIGNNFQTRTNSKDVVIFVKNKYQIVQDIEMGVFLANDVEIADNLYAEAGKILYPYKKLNMPVVKDMLVHAIFFDADNTLYNSKENSELADKEAFKIFQELTPISIDVIYNNWKRIVEKLKLAVDPRYRTRYYSYSLLLKALGLPSSMYLVQKAYEQFENYLLSNLNIIPDLLVFLDEYYGKYIFGIFTEDSSQLAFKKLSKLGLNKYFANIVTSDDVGVMKPSVKYYASLLSWNDVSPHECIFIGDNFEKDLKIPREMSAITVLFDPDYNNAEENPEQNNFEKPNHIIKSYNELFTLINNY